MIGFSYRQNSQQGGLPCILQSYHRDIHLGRPVSLRQYFLEYPRRRLGRGVAVVGARTARPAPGRGYHLARTRVSVEGSPESSKQPVIYLPKKTSHHAERLMG